MKTKSFFAAILSMALCINFISCEEDVAVTGVSLDQSAVTIVKGETAKLNVAVSPDDATDQSVLWATDDSSVATVDQSGTVTAVGAGATTVTVASTDGGFTAVCNVTVIVKVEKVSLDKSELDLIVGQTSTLSATVLPNDATNKNIAWKSDKTSVVSVNKGKLTAVGVGTAVVTVTTEDGSHTSSCTVTVRKSEDIGYNPYEDGQQW